jgi:hypothetical protein
MERSIFGRAAAKDAFDDLAGGVALRRAEGALVQFQLR